MGKSTLSKAALPILHVLQMDVVVPMTRGTKNIGRHVFPSAPNVRDAMLGIALLAVAENHMRTNNMGLQFVVQCFNEHNAHQKHD